MNDLILQESVHQLMAMPKAEIREYISHVEKMLMEYDGPRVEIEPQHHFSKGVYAREIFIPKGSIVVGKIHKFENLNILSKGELLLLSIDGAQHVKAPFTVVSSPGVKRLAVALEDSIWTTVHGTDETDVDIIEEKFIAKTYADVEELCHGSQSPLLDQQP